MKIHLLKSLELILRHYIDLGFYLIPVYPKAKNPIGKDHYKSATNDIKKLLKLAEENPGCNWGLMPKKSGMVVIDVDAHKGGLEVWDQLKGDTYVKTMTARTPRGGLHLIFKAKPDMVYANPFKDQGVDCQHPNIIVIFPSLSKDGVQYLWVDESPIQDFPKELELLFARRKGAELPPAQKLIGAQTFFQKLAVQLKTKELDYGTWLSIGMSIHSAMPTDEGLAIWQDISKGPSWKEGDDEVCRNKWSGFSTAKTDGLSYRSLRFIAKELGCEVPSLSLEEDKLAFATRRQRLQLEADNNPGFFEDDSGRTACWHPEFVINFVNAQGFFVQKEENVGAIGQLITQPSGYKEVFYLKLSELSNAIDNKFLKVSTVNARGDLVIKYIKISKVWLESKTRQEYRKVIFNPKDEDGCLNLWSPLPVTPIEGPPEALEPLFALILDGLADGNYEKGFWLIQWLAHIVQRPFERCSLVPVIIGDQGTGKGMLADRIMGAILGHFHYKINTARTLKERFNHEQANRLLTLIDEASWRGDREEDGILKGLTGSLFMTTERKFGGRQAIENFSRYMILSNNREAVSIERSNRRYVVFEANTEFRHKHHIFDQIAEGLRAGTLQSYFMHYLLSVDLKSFNPNKMVEFNDGQGHQAKIASNGIEALFWEDYFSDPTAKLWYKGNLLKPYAFDAFLSFAKRINTFEKNLNQTKFWTKTSEFFAVKNDNNARTNLVHKRVRVLHIDPISALERFNQTLKLKMDVSFERKEVEFLESEVEKIERESDDLQKWP